MADDRPAESEVEAIARLRRELEDLRTTVMVRASRGSTGDIEPTLRVVAQRDTLLLQGQTVNRADYPVLWQWAQDQALVGAALFTAGNGSTTFGLPNFAGRVLVGVGTLGADAYTIGQVVGAARPVIVWNNLPQHDHSVAISGQASHGGHSSGNVTVFNGAGGGYGLPSFYGAAGGGHNHTVTESPFGAANPTGLDVRQPGIAVNWQIWV